MSAMGEKVWSQSERWVGTMVEDAFVMISLDHGQYVSLNATATDVWNAIGTPNTLDHIVDALTTGYDVPPERCRTSVTELLTKLEGMGLVSSS
jgi:hypothetical protein